MYESKELTKQLTQLFVRIKDQTIFKFQIGFCCHLEKITDIEYENYDQIIRLERKDVRTYSELQSLFTEINTELDAKNENISSKVSGLVFDEI